MLYRAMSMLYVMLLIELYQSITGVQCTHVCPQPLDLHRLHHVM